jgi:hypothetical protein
MPNVMVITHDASYLDTLKEKILSENDFVVEALAD